MDIINSWEFNLIGYLIFIIVFSQYYKLAVKNVKNDGAATILLQLIGGVCALTLIPLYSFSIPTEPKVWLLLLVACVFYALNDRMQTTARKHLQVSHYVILDRLSTIFLIIFGVTIFQNPMIPIKIIGASLILLGNVVALYKKGKFEINKYVWLSVLASLAFATAVSIDIGISGYFNLPFYIALTLFVPAIMLAVVEKITFKDVLEQYYVKDRKYFLITGIAWTFVIFFILRAYQFGEVTIVASLSATAVLLNVAVAYVFLKEHDNKLQKFVAACLTVIGVCLTVLV